MKILRNIILAVIVLIVVYIVISKCTNAYLDMVDPQTVLEKSQSIRSKDIIYEAPEHQDHESWSSLGLTYVVDSRN